jgi:ADP-ribosylglycohydrolase
MSDLEDRISGAMLTSAIGDALGAAVEGFTAERINDLYGSLRDFSQIRVFYDDLPHRDDLAASQKKFHFQRWRQPGLYTDDTQQALLLAEVLVEIGKADRAAYAERIRRGLELRCDELPFGPFRGHGEGFRQVMLNLLEGADANSAHIDSAGCGAAMRIAPVGLYFRDDPVRAGLEAVELSMLTHRDVRTLLSAAAVAVAVALAVTSPPIDDPEVFFDRVRTLTQQVRTGLSSYPLFAGKKAAALADQVTNALANLRPLLQSGYHKAAQAVAGFASECLHLAVPAEHSFCLCSVMMAFWHVLYHRDSLEEAVVSAVNAGGDADTIAAIAGAIAGALHGRSEIPPQWLANLVNREQIHLRAKALAGDSDARAQWQEFGRMELELTLAEHRRRVRVIAG